MPVAEGVLLRLLYASKSLRSKHKKLKYETDIEETKNGETLKTQIDNSEDHTSNCLIFLNGCKEDIFPLAVVLAWNSKERLFQTPIITGSKCITYELYLNPTAIFRDYYVTIPVMKQLVL